MNRYFFAFRQVLISFQVAHQIPLYHRDIRWENIVRRMDDESKWFLIDWEDATTPPTFAQPSFAKETHSPDIFRDGHGQEVDIWAIGYLIQACTIAALSIEIMKLGARIREESHKLSAQEVLVLLKSS